MNTLGTNLRVTTFGESHGPAIGGIIDGFPAGFKIDFDSLQEEIDKRRPGSSSMVTQRKESDRPEFLSGVNTDGFTLGTPIGFIIRNADQHSGDYAEMAEKYRPNHADFTYDARYGIRDPRGGGRASARETANWVVAGALASQWLKEKGIRIEAVLSAVGKVSVTNRLTDQLSHSSFDGCSLLEIPSEVRKQMDEEILNAKNDGDSVGGVVTCVIDGLNPGIGNPVFDKFQASLAHAMLSLNAAKGFEYGLGFESAKKRGSEILDIFRSKEGRISTFTNYSGGLQGGITNGMPIYFNVALKPTPTLFKEIPTVTTHGKDTILKAKGRHDPCVAVRAVPVVKALAALVTADFLI